MIYWCAGQWDVSKYVLSMNAADQYSANNAVRGVKAVQEERKGRPAVRFVSVLVCALLGSIGRDMDRVRVKV